MSQKFKYQLDSGLVWLKEATPHYTYLVAVELEEATTGRITKCKQNLIIHRACVSKLVLHLENQMS